MAEKKFDQFSYQNNFIKEKYDRVNLTVPKGKKEKIKAAAAAEGKSVNDYINAAIDARMSGSVTAAPVQPEAPAEPKKAPKQKADARQQAVEPKTGEVGFIVVDNGGGNYYVGGTYKQDGKKYPVVSSDRHDAKIFTKKFNAQRAIEQVRAYCDMFNFEVEKIML